MDYKILLCCTQEAVAGENAKLSVTIGGTKLVDGAEISSTDAAAPTNVIFEATGLGDPGPDTTVDIVFSIDNDVYIDGENDRNINILSMAYHDKADGTNYKHWDGDTGIWVETTDFTDPKMPRSQYTALVGEDQPDFESGFYAIKITSADVTATYPLLYTSGSTNELGYPVSEHRA